MRNCQDKKWMVVEIGFGQTQAILTAKTIGLYEKGFDTWYKCRPGRYH
jgi:hypothetical protein